jgi:hypothetical protein
MPLSDQNPKGSSRANVFWFFLNFGHCEPLSALEHASLAQVNPIARLIQHA